MVNAAAAIDTGSGSLSLFSRAATASAVLSAGEGAVTAPVQTMSVQATQSLPNLGQTLRYNSFEFSYRQDFGKIVLLRQEPETGEVVQQFPTEYYLEKYAESERATRQPQPAAPEASESEPASADVSGGTAEAAPVVATAPTIASAPALPSGGVDITI